MLQAPGGGRPEPVGNRRREALTARRRPNRPTRRGTRQGPPEEETAGCIVQSARPRAVCLLRGDRHRRVGLSGSPPPPPRALRPAPPPRARPPHRPLRSSRLGSQPSAAPTPRRSPSPRPRSPRAPAPTAAVVVRWFIGIGSGGKPEQVAAEQKFADRLQRGPEGRLPRRRDLRQQRRGQPAPDPDRSRQPAGHHRPGRRRRPQHLPRQPARPRAAHQVAQLRHDEVRPGPRRLLQHRQGRRDHRRPVRDLPVLHLLQQEAVR